MTPANKECPRCNGEYTRKRKTRKRFVLFGRGYTEYECRECAHRWRVWRTRTAANRARSVS